VLRCDNGPELTCAATADWAAERVGLAFIPRGQPWRNSYIESFNPRVRDECLNITMFWSLAHARVVITDWTTLPPAPTNERLSPQVDQFPGSGHEPRAASVSSSGSGPLT
jgi:Integrase core domain